MNASLLQILILVLTLLTPLERSIAADNGAPDDQEPLILLNKQQHNSLSSHPGSKAAAGIIGSPAAPLQGSGVQEELRDIYGPVQIPDPIPYGLIAAFGAALAAIAILSYLFFRRQREETVPSIPAWEKALADLSKARSLMTPEKGLIYMDRASLILRSYIETRFAIKSTRQTTAEFLHSLETGNNEDLQPFRQELRPCLEQADMAKFAHHLSDRETMVRMEEGIRKFVTSTNPATEEGGTTP